MSIAVLEALGPSIAVSPAGTVANLYTSSASSPTTLDALFAEIQSLKRLRLVPDSEGFVNIIPADGTYSSANGYDLLDQTTDGVRFRVVGNAANPENVIFNKTAGSAGFFRVYRSTLYVKDVTISNPTGDGIEAFFAGTNVYVENINWGSILNDMMFADDGAFIHHSGTNRLTVNANPDCYARARECGNIILNGSLDAQNVTVALQDAFYSAIGGNINGSFSVSNDANVTGAKWDQQNGGKIVINGATGSGLNAHSAGDDVFRDRNQDAKVSKLSHELVTTTAIQTALNLADTIPGVLIYNPGTNLDLTLDFVPDPGFTCLFRNNSKLYQIKLRTQGGQEICVMGNGRGPWVRVLYTSDGWEFFQGREGANTGIPYIYSNDGGTEQGEFVLSYGTDQLFIDRRSRDGDSVVNTLKELLPGSYVLIQSETMPEDFTIFELLTQITIVTVDQYTATIRYRDGNTVFLANGDAMRILLFPDHKFGGIEIAKGSSDTIHVRNDGSDGNIGTSPGANFAFQTLKRVNEFIQTYYLPGAEDIAGGNPPEIRINMEPGSYEGCLFNFSRLGKGTVIFNYQENAGVILTSAILITGTSRAIRLSFRNFETGIAGRPIFAYSVRKFYQSTTTTSGYISEPGEGAKDILNKVLDGFSYSISAALIALDNCRVQLENWTYNETPSAANFAPLFIGNGASVEIIGGTYRASHPIAYMADGASLKIFGAPALLGNPFLFDLALAHTIRYLVYAQAGCHLEFSGEPDMGNGNADFDYFARMEGGGHLRCGDNWPQQANIGLLDETFSSEGISISDRGFNNTMLTETQSDLTVSQTIDTRFYGGHHFTFSGAGVIATINANGDPQYAKSKVGSTLRFSAVNGAQLILNNQTAGYEVMINNTILLNTDPALSSTGQTELKMKFTSPTRVVCTVTGAALA